MPVSVVQGQQGKFKLLSPSDSLICEAARIHERPRHDYAVCVPFAVVESRATHLGVALHTVVISPHVVPA